nr:MAG TPA: hypothetical protein [Caudoviricetes sp.]
MDKLKGVKIVNERFYTAHTHTHTHTHKLFWICAGVRVHGRNPIKKPGMMCGLLPYRNMMCELISRLKMCTAYLPPRLVLNFPF